MVEHRIDALATVLGEHAEEQDARAANLPGLEGPEELEDHRKQAARAVPAEHYVEIRQRDPEPDDLTVLLGDRHQLRDHHRLELVRQVIDLVTGHRHEAPVLLPGRVVQLLDPLHLAVEVLHVQRPEGDPHPLPDQLGAPRQALGHGDVPLLAAPLVDP